MLLSSYLNTPDTLIYSSTEYLNLISNHRSIILKNITPKTLDDQEIGFYRHRLHAYLLDDHIPYQYHLPIMVLNNMQSEFEFGHAKNNLLNNNITTIYIPLIETLKDYAKKIRFKQEQ